MPTLRLFHPVPLWLALACGGEPVEPAIPALELETVATGLGFPLYLTAPPGDTERLFVLEKGGWIRIIRNGVIVQPAFLDIQARLPLGGEQGILGLVFHPDYATNGLFLVNYTAMNGATTVSRFRVSADPDRADPASEQVLLTVDQPFDIHNGGMLAIGPRDGHLYIGLGDGGGAGDPHGNAQNRLTLLGSILRLALDPTAQLSIPSDNPFVGQAGARPEIWSYGLRNPWRFSFDRATGDLYIGDVGETEREEINAVTSAAAFGRGANFGWDIMEGTRCFEAPACSSAEFTPPVHEYTHPGGCAVTGGYVYRGSAMPELHGTYFYADFCSGWVKSFRLENGVASDHRDWPELAPEGRITSFGEDANGELYILTAEGRVARVVRRR